MKQRQMTPISLGVALAARAVAITNFSYYQAILDRDPFGEVAPVVAVETAAVPVAAESFAKDYEMKAIIDDGAQLQVALLNKKTSKHVYLNVGQELDGLQLASVDYDKEEAVLKIGLETVVIKLRPDKDKDKSNALPSASAPGTPLFGMPQKSPGAPGATAPFGLGDQDGAHKPFFGDLKRRGASPFQRLGTNAPFQAKSLESFFKPNTNIPLPFMSPFRPQSSPFTPAVPPGATGPESPGATFPFVPVQAPAQSDGVVQPSIGAPQAPAYPPAYYQPALTPYTVPVEEGEFEEFQE
ncbi:MAG: hypothetical protein HYV36_08490 [Lentisphaerae bacterium]|nr:hypothetical protein [Lentisphaerota bacterium]